MERVHLDFLGPLPVTARGNQYILVMWMEVLPLATQTAEAIDMFFSCFGYPFEIFTDQGRNFQTMPMTIVYSRILDYSVEMYNIQNS
jgi:hypothetical protein